MTYLRNLPLWPLIIGIMAVFVFICYKNDPKTLYQTKLVVFYPNYRDTVLIETKNIVNKVYGSNGMVYLRETSFLGIVCFHLKQISRYYLQLRKNNKEMKILKTLPTELLKKMLAEIKDELALIFIRAELLNRDEL